MRFTDAPRYSTVYPTEVIPVRARSYDRDAGTITGMKVYSDEVEVQAAAFGSAARARYVRDRGIRPAFLKGMGDEPPGLFPLLTRHPSPYARALGCGCNRSGKLYGLGVDDTSGKQQGSTACRVKAEESCRNLPAVTGPGGDRWACINNYLWKNCPDQAVSVEATPPKPMPANCVAAATDYCQKSSPDPHVLPYCIADYYKTHCAGGVPQDPAKQSTTTKPRNLTAVWLGIFAGVGVLAVAYALR